jgi:hypothetical protein
VAPCANPVAPGTPGTSTFKAKCFEIRGTATNPGAETVRNADVYGIVTGAPAVARLPRACARARRMPRGADVAGASRRGADVADAENDPVLRSGRVGAIDTLPPVRRLRITTRMGARASIRALRRALSAAMRFPCACAGRQRV